MIPDTFPLPPRVVIICRSKAAASKAVRPHLPNAGDHAQLRFAAEPRDLLGCTDAMAYVDLSDITASPMKATLPLVHLPYGRTSGGARFDHHAARALRTLAEARRLGLQPVALTALAERMK